MHRWAIVETQPNSGTTQKDQAKPFGINWNRRLEYDKLKQTYRLALASEELPHAVQTQELIPPLSYTLLFKQKQPTKPIFKHSRNLHTGIQEGIFTALLHNFSPGLRNTKGQIFTSTNGYTPTIFSTLPNQWFLRSLQNCREWCQLHILLSLQI